MGSYGADVGSRNLSALPAPVSRRQPGSAPSRGANGVVRRGPACAIPLPLPRRIRVRVRRQDQEAPRPPARSPGARLEAMPSKRGSLATTAKRPVKLSGFRSAVFSPGSIRRRLPAPLRGSSDRPLATSGRRRAGGRCLGVSRLPRTWPSSSSSRADPAAPRGPGVVGGWWFLPRFRSHPAVDRRRWPRDNAAIVKGVQMHFVLLATHTADVCPLSNSKTRDLMLQTAPQMPTSLRGTASRWWPVHT